MFSWYSDGVVLREPLRNRIHLRYPNKKSHVAAIFHESSNTEFHNLLREGIDYLVLVLTTLPLDVQNHHHSFDTSLTATLYGNRGITVLGV